MGITFSLVGLADLVSVSAFDRFQNRPEFNAIKALWISAVLVAGAVIWMSLSHSWWALTFSLAVFDGSLALVFVMAETLRKLLTDDGDVAKVGAGPTFLTAFVG